MTAEREQGQPERAQFQVIPAVDILGDEAVRLERGEFSRVTMHAGDPAALVRRFAAARPPFIHVVDLAAARAGGPGPELIRSLVTEAAPVPVQAAGGVRSPLDVVALLDAGAARVVVGTAAFAGHLEAYVDVAGERLVVAVDVRDGLVASHGWKSTTGLTVDEAVDRCLAAGVGRLLCTAIERDGTMAGPDLELLTYVRERSALPVLAAGGIRDERDLAALAATGLEGAVVGRALLEGRVRI